MFMPFMLLLILRKVLVIFSILHMLHQRVIFDVAYPNDCSLSAIHDYSCCFLDYPTIDDTAEKY